MDFESLLSLFCAALIALAWLSPEIFNNKDEE